MCKDLSFLFTNKNPGVIYRSPKLFSNHSHTTIAVEIFGRTADETRLGKTYESNWPEDRMARVEVFKSYYTDKLEFKLDEEFAPPWWKESHRRTLFKHGRWHRECRDTVAEATHLFAQSHGLLVSKIIPGFRDKLNIELARRKSGKGYTKTTLATAIAFQNSKDLARQIQKNYKARFSKKNYIPTAEKIGAAAEILCDLENADFFGVIPLEKIKTLRERWDSQINILSKKE